MKHDLSAVVRLIRERYGRDISLYDESFLAMSLKKRMAAATLGTMAEYAAHLAENAAEAQVMLDSLSIAYSEFFRNPLTFAVLEQLVLPGLKLARAGSARTEIRVWSAGCAAGQEAYSLAILLDGTVPFRIFATDTCQTGLEAARQGVYDAAGVRNVRLKHLQACFSRHGESFRVIDRLRQRCDFSEHDLLDGASLCPPASIFGDFDIVICCNLLYYYSPKVRRALLDKLYRALSPGGYFVTGEAESAFAGQRAGWRSIAPPAAVFRKPVGQALSPARPQAKGLRHPSKVTE